MSSPRDEDKGHRAPVRVGAAGRFRAAKTNWVNSLDDGCGAREEPAVTSPDASASKDACGTEVELFRSGPRETP